MTDNAPNNWFFKALTFFYDRIILAHPIVTLLCLLLILSVPVYKVKDFRIDASAESLLLENDKDLRYTRKITERYGVLNYLIVSYTPKHGDLLSDNTLNTLHRLKDELEKVNGVLSVFSILDAPLLESPPISYSELAEKIQTIESPTVDRNMAKTELRLSHFYKNLIVSGDMKTTALIVNLEPDDIYQEMINRRNVYLEKKTDGNLSEQEATELEDIVKQIRRHTDKTNKIWHENIAIMRSIMDKYRSDADISLGGITMISDDMISFIKNDLKIFGIGVFILLVVMMGIIFKSLRWIILPMLCCFVSVIAMMGILSIFDWEVTVISSNFVSLQLIITLATGIHLIVKYRELLENNPEHSQRTIVLNTTLTKFTPCIYSTLTTIAGFSSLILCDILPVINFGWMMSAGLLLSLVLTFLIVPSSAALLQKENLKTGSKKSGFQLVPFLGRFTEAHGTLIIVVTVIFSVLSIMGISRLEVENSFIDYFKHTTEIYRGMSIIDQKLGGTTPLDIIVEFEEVKPDSSSAEDNEFLDAFEEENEDPSKYWFTDEKMETIEKVHDYLESLPETGKILSLATMLKIGRNLNKGKSLESLELSVLYKKIPEKFRDLILTPFISIEHNEVRFSIRIKDSMKNLRRDALLKRIKNDLVNKLNLKAEHVHLTGTMVLYNNMLQSLFRSQILTLGMVAAALMLMFLILFRSIKISLIAIFPNLLSCGTVLGTLGWMNIPLDMMTITIASISMGIAVDDTIHYICRFREEIKTDYDYYKTLHRCHATIGNAMYYTSITIIIGFSILIFSNFYPTIYFGLFTGLAMVIALIAALCLLPQLIVMFKPYGKNSPKE